MLDATRDPLAKTVSNESVEDVDDPLSRKLAKVLLIRKIESYLGGLSRLRQDVRQSQPLVLRAEQVLYVLAANV